MVSSLISQYEANNSSEPYELSQEWSYESSCHI